MARVPFHNYFSSVKQRFSQLTRHTQIIVIVLGVVLIAGIGTVIYVQLHPKPKGVEKDKILTQIHSYETQSISLSGQGKFNDVIKLWEDYLAKETVPKEFQYEVYLQLANAYLNAGQYDKAKTAFNKVQEAGLTDTPAVAYGLAVIAQNQGDKSTAISQYEKAMNLVKQQLQKRSKDDPNQLQDQQAIAAYQIYINQLKAQK